MFRSVHAIIELRPQKHVPFISYAITSRTMLKQRYLAWGLKWFYVLLIGQIFSDYNSWLRLGGIQEVRTHRRGGEVDPNAYIVSEVA